MNSTNQPRACRRCALTATHPLAHLDADGVCAPCRRSESDATQAHRRRDALLHMEELFAAVRAKPGTHALLAHSGGKDSSWTLVQLRRRYGLSVRALTVDNGFLSAVALENAGRLAGELGAEHVVVRPPLDQLHDLFRGCVACDVFGPTALTRASAVCNACIAAVKSICLREALAHRIPLVVWGWSPGQVPLNSALLRPSASLLEQMVSQLHQPLLDILGERAHGWLVPHAGLRTRPVIPALVSPLALLPYDEQRILAELSELGWRRPRDVDPNSTNCRLNAFAVEQHIARHGFHPYALEMASMVRMGLLDREQARQRLQERSDPETVAAIARELGVE